LRINSIWRQTNVRWKRVLSTWYFKKNAPARRD
jgi:hypothetical protein